MRLKNSLACVLCATWILFRVFSGAQTVTKFTTSDQGLPLVAVSINGGGPYPFLLDTGSNRTLVQEDLLAELGIASPKLVPVYTTNGVSYLHETTAQTVTVGGLSVHDLVIEGIEARQLSRLAGERRGVLGEDFLAHFDLLIDNRNQTLSLDRSSGLASSLSGDHLPLSFSGRQGDHATRSRPVLDVKLSYQRENLHFLIDSGSNHAFLFPSASLPKMHRSEVETLVTLNGKSRCYVDVVTLHLGKKLFPQFGLASCDGITRDQLDVDGTFPTGVLDRLFISHSEKYAIVNPRHIRRRMTIASIH